MTTQQNTRQNRENLKVTPIGLYVRLVTVTKTTQREEVTKMIHASNDLSIHTQERNVKVLIHKVRPLAQDDDTETIKIVIEQENNERNKGREEYIHIRQEITVFAKKGKIEVMEVAK